MLLHGTGGNENDLLPLGRSLLPGAPMLSPRGQVLENGMPRFFRRLAEGVFDEPDLRERTAGLGSFVLEARSHYSLEDVPVIAVGFSNGANMAASLLLLRPGVLAGAVLFRAMVPLVPEEPPSLGGAPVLLSNGRRDPLVAQGETERLAVLLREYGADVTLAWQDAGHNLTADDVETARQWMEKYASVARLLPR
jgi:predicted esterase